MAAEDAKSIIASDSDMSEMQFTTGMKLKDIEKVVILETLKSQNFNRTHAARVLGIGIRTLQRKLKKYGVPNIGLKSEETSETEGLVSGFAN